MTEEEARSWINGRFGVSRETQLEQLAALVCEEAKSQNLIARSTLDAIWTRHILDSAQLVPLAESSPGLWLDIGTGAGFPGLVVALLTDRPVILCEPRRWRADFLRKAAEMLGLGERVAIACAKVETVTRRAAVISARAVAPLDALFAAASRAASPDTLWIFPKGRSAREEVAVACKTWHGSFHVEHSITEPESLIVLAKGVSRR